MQLEINGEVEHRYRQMRFGPKSNGAGDRFERGRRVSHAQLRRKGKVLSLFGNFGPGNLGNESTLEAILYHLRRLLPGAELRCICTDPGATLTTHNITALPINPVIASAWRPRNLVTKTLRAILVGVPSEICRWISAFVALKDTDALIVPGTGLLTDAYGLTNWGPYSMFKWSLIAKMRGCKLLFVSVGAGPIYSRIGRFFVKAALSLADFRSYRDVSTQRYLKSIGFPADRDSLYPDLVFSLPEIVGGHDTNVGRPVVGLGLMGYVGRYSVEKPSMSTYRNYLEGLVILVNWLLVHGYDVRLLIGDLGDQGMTQEFRTLLKKRLVADDGERIIDEPIESVENLVSQLSATDFVVATRFHNVLLALLLNKPVIAISFHHKCSSLMSQMGLADYCQDINHLQADELISQFRQLEEDAEHLRVVMAENVKACRDALDEQYAVMVRKMWSEKDGVPMPASGMEMST